MLEAQADKSNYWQPSIYKVVYNTTTGKQQYAPMSGQTRLYVGLLEARSSGLADCWLSTTFQTFSLELGPVPM